MKKRERRLLICTIALCFTFFGFFLYVKENQLDVLGYESLGAGLYNTCWDGGNIIFRDSAQTRKNGLGSELVPTYERSQDFSSQYARRAEYVVGAKHNDKFVIVRTANHLKDEHLFYIIDKSFDPKSASDAEIINNYISCYSDSAEFTSECKSRNIKLHF